MVILGLTGGIDSIYETSVLPKMGLGHDSSAILIQSDQVVAGIEEERLTRIKHTNKIWSSAVRFCLEQANIGVEDIDAITLYAREESYNKVLRHQGINNPFLSRFDDIRALLQYLFQREFNIKVNKEIFHFIHHHIAHTASSYYLSGFDNALVLTIDGEGDEVSAMVVDVHNKDFNVLGTKSISDSLGHLYLKVITFLGYKSFDEYKVMGLAPYGNPSVYREQFQRFYDLLPEGDYALNQERIIELYDVLTPRLHDEPFAQVHMDIAAALQEALELIVFHILTHYQRLTGHTRLVISGGVGQNSSMNGKILCSGLFEDVFVPSFAGDSGCAYGAAAYVAHQMQPELPFSRVKHAYWGTSIDEERIEDTLASWGAFLHIEKMQNRSEQVADLIAEGAVIGWVQGRSEFGPRALGNRSILADPRVGSHKETINAMIKMRESYRPFAPSILEERVRDFFEVPVENSDFPFMSFVLNVKPEWREQLPAITHVDGTARLQTVSKATNPRYWELIDAFGSKTGVPILLNTSFNNNAEPIVDSIDDAVVCYLTSGLNYLVVGDYLVSKKKWGNDDLSRMTVNIPKAARLIREDRYISDTERGFGHYLMWNYNASRRCEISEEWYNLLKLSDGEQTIHSLMSELAFSSKQKEAVYQELPNLWSERLIILRP